MTMIPPPTFPIYGTAPAWTPAPILCHPTLRAAGDGQCPLCDVEPPEAELDPETELVALENQARRELAELDRDAARTSLAEFVRQGWHVLEGGDLEWSWHHDAICSNVQGMLEEWLAIRARGGATRAWQEARLRNRYMRMCLNICPGTLKSRIVMVYAVAWMWLRCPAWQVLCVSNTPENVLRDSDACRDLITSSWYLTTFSPTWSIRDDISSKSKFQLTTGGFRMSKGMGGTFTGFHVDCVLMDDPDDAHNVHSETERKSRRSKLESLSTRWNDKRNMTWVILQQRVHVDDATGDMIARDGWLHASYPLGTKAFEPAVTPFFRDPRTGAAGQLLHELRFTAEVIAAAKLELGTAGFEAQYEQDPGNTSAGTLKIGWFRWFSIGGWKSESLHRPAGSSTAPAEELGVRRDGKLDLDYFDVSVDATFGSTTDTASEVSMQAIGGKGVKRYVFEDSTKVRTFLETVADLAEMITRWSPHVACVIGVLVEKKANGAAVIETLALDFQGLIAIEPDGGKESRAAAISPTVESGCVYLLDGAAWLDTYLTGSASVPSFPNGKKDDRMDALSQALNHRRADIDAMRLAAKNAALLSLRARLGRSAGFGTPG